MEKLTNVKALEIAISCVSDADVVAKLQTMKAQFEKKNHADRKPTANQLENEKIKNYILANMGDAKYTVTELIDQVLANTEWAKLSCSRMTAILTQLVEDNSVVRTTEKRKAYYSVITDYYLVN